MKKGIDEPIERITEPPVDISERLKEVWQEVIDSRDELARLDRIYGKDEIPRIVAKERYRHAWIVLDYWKRKAVIEQQVFDIIVDNCVFHVVAALAIREVKRSKNSELSIE